MDRLTMCRICLAENVRLCIVANRNMHKLYETLTNIPFITEDSRPMLACVFCFAKLKQCYRLLRQCLKTDELFTQKINDKYEPNPVVNEKHFEIYGGLFKTPIEQINVADCIAVGEELSAVCEGPDDVIEPKEEHKTDELEPENLDISCLEVADIPPHCPESDSEDDVPLITCKFEVEEEEVSKKKRRATWTIQLEPGNLDNSCLDVADKSPHYYESDLEGDVPLRNCKTEVEDVKVSKKNRKATQTIKATVVRKPKENTRRTKENDAITAEQTTKDKSDSKVIRTTQKWTSKPGTYFKEPYVCNRSSSTNVKKEYKCHICQRVYTRRQRLTIHIRTHAGKNPLKCVVCQRTFSRKFHLTNHMRTHTGEKPYRCYLCKNNFIQRIHLKSHMRTHTGEKPYKCYVCKNNFIQSSHLKSHMRTHTGEKPYQCDICQRNFSHKNSLTKHMHTHTGEKPYQCDICQRNFSQKNSLTKHMHTHTGEKPYQCDICQRNFSRKCHLTDHMHTHTGENPYQCDICQRHFSLMNSFTKHMHIHTGEKPYQCDICQRNFSQKSSLTEHMRIHTGEKPYQCDICQRNFSHKNSLRKHMHIHTGEKPYQCDICQRNFSQKSSLTRHRRTHW